MSKNQEWVSQKSEGGEEINLAASGMRRQPEKKNKVNVPEGIIRDRDLKRPRLLACQHLLR